MDFERTIDSPVEASGIGLHSGVKVRMRLLPARAGKGVVFSRKDLDSFELPAVARHIARVSYATSLMRQGVLLSTTEHLLSVFYSLGIDNARVEIDNLELPILDGSGKPFVELIRNAGVRELSRPRTYLRILKTVGVREGKKTIVIHPADHFAITCETDYGHALAGRQTLEMVVTPERYAREIAPARTFGFERDLDRMRDMGLIRGASLENAVCFGPDGVLNPEGLRFPDECCRHKVLDLIGDLALLGRPLLGHVVAEHAGHAMHTALVKQILSDASCYELVHSDQLASKLLHAEAV